MRKYKLQNEKLTQQMEEQIENKNETIVDLHIQVVTKASFPQHFGFVRRFSISPHERDSITSLNYSFAVSWADICFQKRELTAAQKVRIENLINASSRCSV